MWIKNECSSEAEKIALNHFALQALTDSAVMCPLKTGSGPRAGARQWDILMSLSSSVSWAHLINWLRSIILFIWLYVIHICTLWNICKQKTENAYNWFSRGRSFWDFYHLFFQGKLNFLRREIVHFPVYNGYFFVSFIFLSEKAMIENIK